MLCMLFAFMKKQLNMKVFLECDHGNIYMYSIPRNEKKGKTLVSHTVGRALSSDCSVNTFIMVII